MPSSTYGALHEGDRTAVVADERLRRRALVIVGLVGTVLAFAQALVPFDEFVHRGDDAFYYFGIARNFTDTGSWTFDRIHETNGVQPLWALLLTAAAQVLAWAGISDAHVLARVFVGMAAACHVAASLILFRLLARLVSTGTAVVAAGAFLLPMGIVWSRLWGMENSLFALLLLGTVAFFHLSFLERGSERKAIFLGVLLGLTGLARLNAGLLIPCLLGYYLLRRVDARRRDRIRRAAIAAGLAGLILGTYYAVNLAATGHLLPVSGVAKRVEVGLLREERGIDSVLSPEYAELMRAHAQEPLKWMISSRAVDALWPFGSRAVFDGSVRMSILIGLLAVLALAPIGLIGLHQWLALLRERYSRLLPLSYVLLFALMNGAISLVVYPTEFAYAGIRWWFVESEIVIVILVATLVAAALAAAARRLSSRTVLHLATAGLLALAGFHGQQHVRFFWDGEVVHHDWNLSWNDESYRAARWLAREVPRDARVGSWNAGVLGYYAQQRVVNLDGLINDFELTEFLERRRIADYIRREQIAYLSDMEDMFTRTAVRRDLDLTLVYTHYSEFARSPYRIYRVNA